LTQNAVDANPASVATQRHADALTPVLPRDAVDPQMVRILPAISWRLIRAHSLIPHCAKRMASWRTEPCAAKRMRFRCLLRRHVSVVCWNARKTVEFPATGEASTVGRVDRNATMQTLERSGK
jgi:hypothetical protein